MWLEGWMGGSWQRVAGNHGGPRGEEGGRGWIGGSSGEPDLTNELIAGGAHSPTSPSFVFAKRERALAKYFWTLCATLVWEENIYCPSPVPI